MSVRWNCEDCEAYKAAKDDEQSDQYRSFVWLRNSLIYALLVTQFPRGSQWAITESNWREVFKRLYVLERCRSAYRQRSGKPIYFEPNEVFSMIGLQVNAGDQTEIRFGKRIIELVRFDAAGKLRAYDDKCDRITK